MPTPYISVKDTAVELRKALKAAFPSVKFSVRSDSYAGGASINVRYTDGPRVGPVEKVAKQFAGASFDGMIDLKSYHTSQHEGQEVHWGADFVFVTQDFSPEVTAQATTIIRDDILGENGTFNEGRFYEAPQVMFSRANVVNGGKREDGQYNFSWGDNSTHQWIHIMASWIAAENHADALVSA